jgi:hypothetical protein
MLESCGNLCDGLKAIIMETYVYSIELTFRASKFPPLSPENTKIPLSLLRKQATLAS